VVFNFRSDDYEFYLHVSTINIFTLDMLPIIMGVFFMYYLHTCILLCGFPVYCAKGFCMLALEEGAARTHASILSITYI
jgi:hypothetical protein